MKKLIVLILGVILCATLYAQNSPCPGLKNPNSFTSGSMSGSFIGYYSGQTGNKPSSASAGAVAPDAMTGATGVNMTSAIINAAELSTITGNGGTSYCGSSLNPTNLFRIMSSTEGPGTGTQLGKDPLVN